MCLPAARDDCDDDDDERKNAKLDQVTGLHMLPQIPMSLGSNAHEDPQVLGGARKAVSELRWRAAARRSAAERSKEGTRREFCG